LAIFQISNNQGSQVSVIQKTTNPNIYALIVNITTTVNLKIKDNFIKDRNLSDLVGGKLPNQNNQNQTGVCPADLSIIVLNGSGQMGVATKAAQELSSQGYKISKKGDANSYNYQTTTVLYPLGCQNSADIIANLLSGAASSTNELTGAIKVIIGRNYSQ
jgi:hypothetical protein